MSVAFQVDPHNNMKARDVNKVARGEQAPRPAHECGSINSAPPKPSSSDSSPPPSSHNINKNIKVDDDVDNNDDPARHCYASYLQYHKCIKEKGKSAPECERFEKNYRSLCPIEWIKRWDEEQMLGTFAGSI